VHVAVDHRDDPPLPSGGRGQVTAEDALRLRHGAIESTPWAQLVHRTPFAMVNQKQNKNGKHWDAMHSLSTGTRSSSACSHTGLNSCTEGTNQYTGYRHPYTGKSVVPL
jgi:hypothetical protein